MTLDFDKWNVTIVYSFNKLNSKLNLIIFGEGGIENL